MTAWSIVGAGLLLGLLTQCSEKDSDGASGGATQTTGGVASGGGGGGAVSASGGATQTTSGGASGGRAAMGGAASGGRIASAGGASGGDGGSSTTEGGESSDPEAGPAGGPAVAYWEPKAGLSWQWQLSESVGEPLDVDVYDIDWESDASAVERLHARGIKVICYVSVGSWEDFRPDADDFPEAVIGNDYDGWPGEKYVDIRAEALRDIVLRRFDTCRDKGFDAIEPDNMDVFELGDDSGFPLTRADGLAYARFLAEAAHARGLGIGQKNAAALTGELEPLYQWALTEDCYGGGRWCNEVSAYIDAGKPVFMCEYDQDSFAGACDFAEAGGYSPILKNLDLDADITLCP